MDANLQRRLVESELLADWIDGQISGLKISNDIRTRIAVGCLDMVHEHQRAIVELVIKQLYGSALALMRPQFDSLVRGIWFHRCASDEDLVLFQKDKLDKKIRIQISDIEKIDSFSVRFLSITRQKTWDALCSYTHSGFLQITRRNKPNEIGPNYKPEELVDALDYSGVFGLLALMESAYLTNNEMIARSTVTKAESWLKKSE